MRDRITIYIPNDERDVIDWLEATAKQRDRSVSYIIVEAIREKMEREGADE